ncbi:hypothetical protein GF373_14690 [bacterium]|nr:hypothetical protein [bacterium]
MRPFRAFPLSIYKNPLFIVAIIGIVAAIAAPNFLNAPIRAKVTKTQANQKAVVPALKM